jgi:hypothetical protein
MYVPRGGSYYQSDGIFFLVGMFLISEIDVFILSCGYTFQTYAESKGQNLRLTLHSTRSIQMSMMD